VLDAGRVKNISGFVYGPSYKGEGGVIIEYDLEYSRDGENWTRIISGGQFDNIVNNPTDREIDLPSVVRARYLRLIPLRSDRSSTYGVSTFDITE
jgi:alpha-L-fucosidase